MQGRWITSYRARTNMVMCRKALLPLLKDNDLTVSSIVTTVYKIIEKINKPKVTEPRESA